MPVMTTELQGGFAICQLVRGGNVSAIALPSRAILSDKVKKNNTVIIVLSNSPFYSALIPLVVCHEVCQHNKINAADGRKPLVLSYVCHR